MKYKGFLILFIFLLSCQQEDTTKKTAPVMTDLREDWTRYKFSSDIKKSCDSIQDQHSTSDAATLYANVGNYFSAMEVFDRDFFDPNGNTITVFDSSAFKAVPAIDYIIKEASKSRVIMINEAHHVPYHRFFTMLLLKKLSEQGFTYFGAEGLNLWDSSLTKTGHPTITSGYLAVEPQYGNLLREALNTGFTVFAYEPNEKSTEVQREIGQAKNIQKILQKDPKAKIIIHCGYDHLIESDYPAWGKAMAGRLKEYTGIDPFTIDQVELTEHSEKQYENSYYGKIEQADFSVLIPKHALPSLNVRRDKGSVDIFVYHPRTHLKYNRPQWLFQYYTPTFITNDINISFPVLVKAYISTENEKDAVPVDVIEINSEADTTALALIPKNSYKILIENKQKQKQTLNSVVK